MCHSHQETAGAHYGLVFMLFYATCVNYIVRVSLSIAAPVLARELSLSPAQVGLLLSSFSWSYVAFMVAAGWLADRYSPARVLGIGLFISTISATQQQAMMTTFFFIMPFFMLSGFIFPIDNMPTFVQWLTYLNPLRYFLVIIRGIFLKGVALEVLWPQYMALAILGMLVFSGAILRFKKRLD
jgi:ABC-type multidrug transport system permease subunit